RRASRAVTRHLARRNPRGPRKARDRRQPLARVSVFYIRPIARDDLPAVLALSERTGSGLTTLPANRERLRERIERSLASFDGNAERKDACYMFVLVEQNDGSEARVVG